jgi:hypothetical protein
VTLNRRDFARRAAVPTSAPADCNRWCEKCERRFIPAEPDVGGPWFGQSTVEIQNVIPGVPPPGIRRSPLPEPPRGGGSSSPRIDSARYARLQSRRGFDTLREQEVKAELNGPSSA